MTQDPRTSDGEAVRRIDLERAAGAGRGAARVAGYEGIALARNALAGDQAALDAFHARVGLALPVLDDSGIPVRLVLQEIKKETGDPAILGSQIRAGFQTSGEYDTVTSIDASTLVAWILSPDGRAALARRGVNIPIFAVDLAFAAGPTASLFEELRAAITSMHVPVEESDYARGFNAALHEALLVVAAKAGAVCPG